MLTRPAHIFVFALSSLLVLAKSGPNLLVEVTGPARVNDVSNFKVNTTVKNTGDVSLKLLTDPRGPLSKTPSNTFTITNVNGTQPAFTGVHIKYVHQTVASLGRSRSFTVLDPGQSVTVEHDLSAAYNFSVGGEGIYTVLSHNNFHYLNTTSNTSVPITAESVPLKTILTGILSRGRPAKSNIQKRSKFQGCSKKQQAQINQAATVAKSLAKESLAYLNSMNGTSARFTTWFGKFSSANKAKVLAQYKKIANNDFSAMEFDCSTCDEEDSFAFVYPDEFPTVYLCDAFWDAPMNGTDSKAGTLVHETSHFEKIAATEDTAYGQSDCKKLAKQSPKEAIGNADSHEYFSENHPTLR